MTLLNPLWPAMRDGGSLAIVQNGSALWQKSWNSMGQTRHFMIQWALADAPFPSSLDRHKHAISIEGYIPVQHRVNRTLTERSAGVVCSLLGVCVHSLFLRRIRAGYSGVSLGVCSVFFGGG